MKDCKLKMRVDYQLYDGVIFLWLFLKAKKNFRFKGCVELSDQEDSIRRERRSSAYEFINFRISSVQYSCQQFTFCTTHFLKRFH